MIRDKFTEQLYIQLPAYINGTLNPLQRKIVELWLNRDEQACIAAENLKILQTAVQRQPRRTPPAAVLERIQSQIRSQQTAPHHTSRPIPRPIPGRSQALGFPVLLLSVLTLILAATVMWQTLPPGIVLQWSVEGRAPETFRVYRAEVDSGSVAEAGQFELLEEVPVTNQGREYTFTDFRLLPGQNFVYRVEGLNAAGQPAASQTISGRAIDALPGQLAILLVLVFTAYCFWSILRLWRPVTTVPA